jgi:hypothetical protein
MRINKDHVIGAIVMLLVAASVTASAMWCVQLKQRVERVTRAHDNLVAILNPVLQQIQAVNQAQRAQAQQGSAVPAPKKAPEAK